MQNTIDELKQFARQGVNGNYLSFRQDWPDFRRKSASPSATRSMISRIRADLPQQFRDVYAAMKRSQALQDALTKAGDSLTKQRNAINSFLVKVRTSPTWTSRLETAGKSSTTEGLRSVG